MSQSNPTKGISPVHQKKPQRKSLPPRLASERSSPSNSATARTPAKAASNAKTSLSSVTTKVTMSSNATGEDEVEVAAANEENNTLSDETSEALSLNVAPSDKPSEAELCTNGDTFIQEKPELALVQEPIAAEH